MCEFNLNESQSKPRGFGRKKKVRWVRTSAGGPPVRRFDGMCFIKLFGGRTDRSFGTAPFPRFLFYRHSVRQVRQLAPGLIVRYIKRHLQTAGLGETSAASVLTAPLQQMMLHQRDAHTSKRRTPYLDVRAALAELAHGLWLLFLDFPTQILFSGQKTLSTGRLKESFS